MAPPPPRPAPPEQTRPHLPPPPPPAGLRRDDATLRASPPPRPSMPPAGLRRDDAKLRASPPPRPAPPPMPPARPYSFSGLRTRQRLSPMPGRTGSSTADQSDQQTRLVADVSFRRVPPTPRPATPTRDELLDQLLNRAVAERKLRMSQMRDAPQQTREEEEELVVAAHKLHMPQRSEDADQARNLKASSPPVYSLSPRRLSIEYFVRVDIGGTVHTYPTLPAGPFQSLKDAQDAIDSHHAQQSKMMCMKGLSQMEIAIRRALYGPDGLRKNSAEALAYRKDHRPEDEMVRALLDKYNEENNLSGDLAYELIKVVHFKSVRERNGTSNSLFYHLNLVIRTKGADGRSNNLFFAEVARMEGKYEEYALTFFCMLKPDDNGKCIECDAAMKHPSDVEYHRGREKIPRPGVRIVPDGGTRAYIEELAAVYDEAGLKAQEARVRKEFEELYARSRATIQKKYVVPARRQEQGVASAVRSTA